MSLRNTLVLCAAVVAAGGVAGLAMRPQGWLAQINAPSSDYAAATHFDPATRRDENSTRNESPAYDGGATHDNRIGRDQRTSLNDRPQYPGYNDQPGNDERAAHNDQYPRDDRSARGGPSQRSDTETISLSQIEQADRTLPHMPVENENGARIGEVAQVMMDGNGKAREVVLDRGTRIAAGDLRFMPSRSVLIAQVTDRGGRDPNRNPQGQPASEPQRY